LYVIKSANELFIQEIFIAFKIYENFILNKAEGREGKDNRVKEPRK
jgi:hypothetical protein